MIERLFFSSGALASVAAVSGCRSPGARSPSQTSRNSCGQHNRQGRHAARQETTGATARAAYQFRDALPSDKTAASFARQIDYKSPGQPLPNWSALRRLYHLLASRHDIRDTCCNQPGFDAFLHVRNPRTHQ